MSKIIIIISAALISISSYSFLINNNHAIYGTWISEDDPKVSWVFSEPNKVNQYYDGVAGDEYNFRLSDTSPQCGNQVQTGEFITFLELTDTTSGEQMCYYFNGVSETHLSLSFFDRGGTMVFDRVN
jgi:hypothetical protein